MRYHSIICPPYAQNQSPSFNMRPQALSAAVKVDKEEWVGIIGRAVGHFDGRLDMDAVLKGSSAVSLHQLTQDLCFHNSTHLVMPSSIMTAAFL